MFKTICALLRKKPEIMDIVSLSEATKPKKKPVLKKATTRKPVAKKPAAKVAVKKTAKKKNAG